ncbi:STAS domain-containing protein [Oceanobacillus massiliensis]|uniref:STAS domain-containing protein n=1 Tax=Oceanobacillus massiliensis TaxID=1465765 RepID=UPI003016C456
MHQVDSMLPVFIFKINENLHILEYSPLVTEFFAAPSSIMEIVENDSKEKVRQSILPDIRQNTFEANIIDKSGKVFLAEFFTGWNSDLSGEVLIIKKREEKTRVAGSVDDLKLRLKEADVELLKEKERAEEMIVENNRLSAPFICVTEDMALVPLFGEIDKVKVKTMIEHIVKSAYKAEVKRLLIDLTAVGHIDREGLAGLGELFKSIQVLGKDIVVTGINPNQAQQLHHRGFSMEIEFSHSLQAAIKEFV